MTVRYGYLGSAIIFLYAFAPICNAVAGHSLQHTENDKQFPASPAQSRNRQTLVTNGSATSPGQFPFLAAVLSGRRASVQINSMVADGYYFGGGMQDEFTGPVMDCGLALGPCFGVSGKVCAIVLDFPSEGIPALTPAQQLLNCSDGGGVGAVFRPNPNGIGALDLVGTTPSIPAVYLFNNDGYQKLSLALQSNVSSQVSVTASVPDTILCGGTYLGGAWVLTAAHCVVDINEGRNRIVNPQELLVDVGAYALGDEPRFAQRVVEIVTNNYRTVGPWGRNDYALLRLEANPARGVPISLVSQQQLDSATAASENAVVIGWGSTRVREPLTPSALGDYTSNTPLSATLKLYPAAACSSLWRDFFNANRLDTTGLEINSNHICAANVELQQDTCQGDSGGPLLVNIDGELKLAGVTSFGLGCGSSNSVPGVYSSTPSFSDWITNNTGLSLFDNPDRFFSDPVLTENSAFGKASGGSFSVFSIGFLFLYSLIAGTRNIRTTINLAGLLVVVALLAGCKGDNPALEMSGATAQSNQDTLEKLDAVYDSDHHISAQVVSSGCTASDDFSVSHHLQQDSCFVVVKRVTPDLCKKAASVVNLKIDWPLPAECSAAQVNFVNPPLTED